jgi:hypothetical protein
MRAIIPGIAGASSEARHLCIRPRFSNTTSNTRFRESPHLFRWMLSAGNRAQNERVIERHYQRFSARLQDSIQSDCFSAVAQ